jgi:hypothetical protein
VKVSFTVREAYRRVGASAKGIARGQRAGLDQQVQLRKTSCGATFLRGDALRLPHRTMPRARRTGTRAHRPDAERCRPLQRAQVHHATVRAPT